MLTSQLIAARRGRNFGRSPHGKMSAEVANNNHRVSHGLALFYASLLTSALCRKELDGQHLSSVTPFHCLCSALLGTPALGKMAFVCASELGQQFFHAMFFFFFPTYAH